MDLNLRIEDPQSTKYFDTIRHHFLTQVVIYSSYKEVMNIKKIFGNNYQCPNLYYDIASKFV